MKDLFKTFLNLFIKPVNTTNNETENATLKFGFIHAAIITAVFTFCNLISELISELFVKRYDYSSSKMVTKLAFDNIKILNLLGAFFKTAIFIFGFIMAFAGIILVISKILKIKVPFAKALKVSTFALTPYMVARILSLLFAWFSPISVTVMGIAQVYFIVIALFSVKHLLNDGNEDKLALCYIILIGGVTLVLNGISFILGLIGSSFLSFLGL